MVTFVKGDIFKSPVQVLTNTVKHLGALPDLDVYVYEPHNVAAIKDDTEERDSGSQIDDKKISARRREVN